MNGSELADTLGISSAPHGHHTAIVCVEAWVVEKIEKGQTTWCTRNEPVVKKTVRILL